jgi:hypothetical protein
VLPGTPPDGAALDGVDVAPPPDEAEGCASGGEADGDGDGEDEGDVVGSDDGLALGEADGVGLAVGVAVGLGAVTV